MGQTKQRADEKKTASASYVINFYETVGNLTSTYAQYCNIIVELEARHTGADLEKSMTMEERTALTQAVQNVRYHILTSHVLFTTIAKVSKNFTEERLSIIKEQREEVLKEFFIKRDKLEEYVVTMNEVLSDAIMTEMLKTSQDFIDSVYGQTEQ